MQCEMGGIFSTNEGVNKLYKFLVWKSEERRAYLDDVQVDGRIVGYYDRSQGSKLCEDVVWSYLA
jgi:hypothetical protein